MPHDTKIATCCYCGARAALVLSGTLRHELSCASCGAPLSRLKQMPSRPAPQNPAPRPQKPGKLRKKPRKTWAKWALEEAWDAIEDIFD